jgi:hypothetical protein
MQVLANALDQQHDFLDRRLHRLQVDLCATVQLAGCIFRKAKRIRAPVDLAKLFEQSGYVRVPVLFVRRVAVWELNKISTLHTNFGSKSIKSVGYVFCSAKAQNSVSAEQFWPALRPAPPAR